LKLQVLFKEIISGGDKLSLSSADIPDLVNVFMSLIAAHSRAL